MATFTSDIIKGAIATQTAINNNNPLTTNSAAAGGGFNGPAAFQADGSGLPFTKVPVNTDSEFQRNIITWFVPQFGTVRMYVNPQNITYTHKKLITKDRTKGGFTLQYWGEDLDELNISGTTGSSGIEGINMLYEIYRAEQFAFDGTGIALAANNAAADLSNNIVNGIGGAIGKNINLGGGKGSDTSIAGATGLLGGILGLDSPNNSLSAKNIPSLAQLAFTVEMYYAGWIYRGYFNSMSVTESADNFLMQYQINFIATQRRGYRVNRFGWERSAKNGPSAYNSPNSFNGNIING